MRSLERQGITDRMPQVHLGPAAAAMECKGVSTERGEENPLSKGDGISYNDGSVPLISGMPGLCEGES